MQTLSATALAFGELTLKDKEGQLAQTREGEESNVTSQDCVTLPARNLNDSLMYDNNLHNGFCQARSRISHSTTSYSPLSARSLYEGKRQRKISPNKAMQLLHKGPGTSHKAVISINDATRYWSVDENGVVTTETFMRMENPKRSWCSVLIEFVLLFIFVLILLLICQNADLGELTHL